MEKYRVTKPIVDPNTGREIHPRENRSVKLTGRQAEAFYRTGCVDNKDMRDRKGKIKHELDKRNH